MLQSILNAFFRIWNMTCVLKLISKIFCFISIPSENFPFIPLCWPTKSRTIKSFPREVTRHISICWLPSISTFFPITQTGIKRKECFFLCSNRVTWRSNNRKSQIKIKSLKSPIKAKISKCTFSNGSQDRYLHDQERRKTLPSQRRVRRHWIATFSTSTTIVARRSSPTSPLFWEVLSKSLDWVKKSNPFTNRVWPICAANWPKSPKQVWMGIKIKSQKVDWAWKRFEFCST